MAIDYREKAVDLRVLDKYIDFIHYQYCIATVKKVEHIKEEFVSFKTKQKSNWYVTFYFNDWCFYQRYMMEHSTDYNSKYKSFKRVADRAMKKLNVDLSELIDKKFRLTIASTYRLDKSNNKYHIFHNITNMELIVEESINENTNM